jgi:hypothetical protein
VVYTLSELSTQHCAVNPLAEEIEVVPELSEQFLGKPMEQPLLA